MARNGLHSTDDCMLWNHVHKDDNDSSVSVVRGALKVVRQRWLHEAVVKLTYSCTVTTGDGRCEGKDNIQLLFDHGPEDRRTLVVDSVFETEDGEDDGEERGSRTRSCR
jgi:hypothetical protein